MNQVDELRKKSITGVIFSSGFGFMRKGVGFLGNIFLARLLAPEDFGIFAIVAFVLNTCKLFSDVGLGVSVIQKEEDPGQDVLSSIFFFQQIFVTIAIGLLIAALPWIADIYPTYKPEYNLLTYLLCFEFFISSLRAVPKSVMARDVDFKKIALIEAVENLVYWSVTIVLAYLGYRVWALAFGIFFRSVVGTILFFWYNRWFPTFVLKWSLVKAHLTVGIGYQLGRLVAHFRGAINPTIIGHYFGIGIVGQVAWAYQIAHLPMFIVYAIDNVSLSFFARLQDDLEQLSSYVTKSLEYSFFLLIPLVAYLGVESESIITQVFTAKWLDARWLLVFYCVHFSLMALNYPLYTSLLSLGHVNFLLWQGVVLGTLEFAGVFLLKEQFGPVAIAYSQVIGLIFNFILSYCYLGMKRGVWVKVTVPLVRGSLIVVPPILLTWWVRHNYLPEQITSILATGLIFFSSYGLLILLFHREMSRKVWNIVKSQVS